MSEEEGELSQALKRGEMNAPIVKETSERRLQMRSYFGSECERLGLTDVFSQQEDYASGRVTGSEIRSYDISGLESNKMKRNFQLPKVGNTSFFNRASRGEEVKLPKKEQGENPVNYIDYDAIDASGLNLRSMGEQLTARYAGYFLRKGNVRARAPGTDVEFNEKFLDMSWLEAQRVISHELQHVKTFDDMVRWQDEGEGRPQEELYLWTFHESFDDLYQKMSAHYHTRKEEGYPFGKTLERPTFENRENVMNYAQYNETLSLLRGLEVYLRQKQELLDNGMDEAEAEKQLTTQPYEFIEAFKEKDLKFLSADYRTKVADEVIKSNSDIATLVEESRNTQYADEVLEIDL